jgi:hypothetical protein
MRRWRYADARSGGWRRAGGAGPRSCGSRACSRRSGQSPFPAGCPSAGSRLVSPGPLRRLRSCRRTLARSRSPSGSAARTCRSTRRRAFRRRRRC